MKNKFKRINDDAIAGVCSGMAYWLGIQTWMVRVAWACVGVFFGTGVALYIILWICVPRWDNDPPDYEEVCD